MTFYDNQNNAGGVHDNFAFSEYKMNCIKKPRIYIQTFPERKKHDVCLAVSIYSIYKTQNVSQ